MYKLDTTDIEDQIRKIRRSISENDDDWSDEENEMTSFGEITPIIKPEPQHDTYLNPNTNPNTKPNIKPKPTWRKNPSIPKVKIPPPPPPRKTFLRKSTPFVPQNQFVTVSTSIPSSRSNVSTSASASVSSASASVSTPVLSSVESNMESIRDGHDTISSPSLTPASHQLSSELMVELENEIINDENTSIVKEEPSIIQMAQPHMDAIEKLIQSNQQGLDMIKKEFEKIKLLFALSSNISVLIEKDE